MRIKKCFNAYIKTLLFLLVFIEAVGFLPLNAAADNLYPDYLNGDSNYILCDGHMGYAWYVDRSSLTVQKYEPPQYIIAVNVVTVPNADRGNTAISEVKTYRFFYNSDLGQMYVDSQLNDNWRYLNPRGCWAETGIVMPAGEIAFALAYNMKFYGSYAGFSDSFYDRI